MGLCLGLRDRRERAAAGRGEVQPVAAAGGGGDLHRHLGALRQGLRRHEDEHRVVLEERDLAGSSLAGRDHPEGRLAVRRSIGRVKRTEIAASRGTSWWSSRGRKRTTDGAAEVRNEIDGRGRRRSRPRSRTPSTTSRYRAFMRSALLRREHVAREAVARRARLHRSGRRRVQVDRGRHRRGIDRTIEREQEGRADSDPLAGSLGRRSGRHPRHASGTRRGPGWPSARRISRARRHRR